MDDGMKSIVTGVIFLIFAIIFLCLTTKYSYLGIALIIIALLLMVTGYMRKNK